MARELSSTGMRALFESQTDEVFIILLTIEAEGLDDPIRVSSDGVDTISRDELFLHCPFQIGIPPEKEDQPPQVMLRLDNADRLLVDAIRSLASPPTITMEIVLASDPNTVEAGPFVLTLRNVTYDAAAIEGTLMYEDVLNQTTPAGIFWPGWFPGLV